MTQSATSRQRVRPPKRPPQTPAQRMRAYRARKRAAGLKRAATWVPAGPGAIVRYSDHRLREARSLALHCLSARKIEREPALLDVARRNLESWSERAQGKGPRYLREWREVLEQPWPAIAEFITSFGERAVRLRQSSPFAGILTPEERRRVYDAFRA